jgi:hypothetical protein
VAWRGVARRGGRRRRRSARVSLSSSLT